MSKTGQEVELEIRVTEEERQFALGSLSLLPASMKTPAVAAMLAEAARNREVADQLRSDPGSLFERCECPVPPGVRIEVHECDAHTVHLVLPAIAAGSAGDPETSGAVITDADLLSEGLRRGAKKMLVSKTEDGEKKGKPDDAWGGDKGDKNNWYNSGNYYDNVRGDDR